MFIRLIKNINISKKYTNHEILLVDQMFLSLYDNKNKKNKNFYGLLLNTLKNINDKNLLKKKFLIHFGDNNINHNNINMIVKTRPINNINLTIFNINKARHWNKIKEVKKYDIPFNKKINKLIWRGTTTGIYNNIMKGNIKRFVLVTKYFRDKWCDIGFSKIVQNNDNFIKYIKNKINIQNMLKYKYHVSVEGNDVASDLKWKLYSNSVVFMTKPTIISWCMEDKLIPYKHYIPLNNDFSDLQYKYEWAENNQDRCEYIVRQSTKYIEQFLDDDKEKFIEKEVLTRYLKNI